VVTPLVPILIFSAIFAYGLRLPLGNAPYVLAFAAAYVPWIFLSGSISGAAGSLVEHRYLIKKVVFPIEIIPADPVVAHALPHGILLLLVGAACAFAGYGRFPDALLVLYFFACGAVFAVSAGFLVSAITVVVRDLQQTLPSILHVWFWLTPIAWPAGRLPLRARALLALNPAAYIVSGYRHALMPAAFAAPSPFETAMFWLISAGTLLLGASSFRRLRADFWDCL
jgi:teichoic acid transport system permease protein